MKNQYVGDIGDYGKYSLFRYLALNGIQIGVNWYLTDNDRSKDGRFTEYLKNDVERTFDPSVYEKLSVIVEHYSQFQRTVQMVQSSEMIPKAVFFDEKMDSGETKPLERAWKRREWFERSGTALAEAELIFSDPDNGISYKKTSRNKGCEKYILPEEIALYYYSGKDVAFYCHKGRRTDDKWERAKSQIKEYISDARLFALTFHRGTQRSYIFVVHPERQNQYETMLKKFLSITRWGQEKIFTWEKIQEYRVELTPDLCEKMAVLNYFQKSFPTKEEKEIVLERMTNEGIDRLINASSMAQGKHFYASKKKTGFAAPVIGTIYPKGSIIRQNGDGTITVVPPSDEKSVDSIM